MNQREQSSTSPTIRKMHFSDPVTNMFLLSITGHDIIHDYGAPSDRWKNNLKLLEKYSGRSIIDIPDTNYFVDGGTSVAGTKSSKGNKTSTSPKSKPSIKPSSTLMSPEQIQPPAGNPFETQPETDYFGMSQNTPDKESQELFEERGQGMNLFGVMEQEEEPQSQSQMEIDVAPTTPKTTTVDPLVLDRLYYARQYWHDVISTKILLCFFYKFLHYYRKTKQTTIELSNLSNLLTPSDYSMPRKIKQSTTRKKIRKYLKKDSRRMYGGDSSSRSSNKSKSKSKSKSQKSSIHTEPSTDASSFIQSVINHIVSSVVDHYNSTSTKPTYDNVLETLTNEFKTNTNDYIEQYFKDIKTLTDCEAFIQNIQKSILQNNLESKFMSGDKAGYESEIQEIVKKVITIYKQYDSSNIFQDESARIQYQNSIESNVKQIFPVIPNSDRMRTKIPDVNTFVKDKITNKKTAILKPYYIALKRLRTEEKKRIENEKKVLSGDLTKEDKHAQNHFVEFVAKSSLFINNICDQYGNIIADNIPDIYLKIQASILIKQANWEKVGDNKRKIYNMTKNLDDELLNYMIELSTIPSKPPQLITPTQIHQKKEKIMNTGICGPIKNHVSNNAATSLPKTAKTKLVCSTSALLDGMPTCNYKADKTHSTQLSWERGNMNFMITNNNESIYYQGSLTLDPSDETKVDLQVQVQTLSGFQVGKVNHTSVVDESLKAYVALKHTLRAMIIYIVVSDHTILQPQTSQTKDLNIFENLFLTACTQDKSKRDNIFNLFYSEILYKGVGDLFQEINSACKFGGYVNILQPNPNNINFDRYGNATRYFAANDRPSGVRFVLFLTLGAKKDPQNRNRSEINSGAFGGYLGDQKQLIVEHENYQPCIGEGDMTRSELPSRQKTDERSLSISQQPIIDLKVNRKRERSTAPVSSPSKPKKTKRGGYRPKQFRQTKKLKYTHKI